VPEPISIQASMTATGVPLQHFWSTVVGAGRANEGLRADWQAQLAAARDACGFDGETEDFTAHHYPAEVTHSVPASFDDRTVAERTETTGEPRSLELVLDGLRPGAVMAVECLGTEHGNAVAAWRRLGCPRETTREQERLVDRLARATSLETFVADADRVARLTTMLAPWSVVLVRQTHQQGEWA
jgi:hypothetical protein